MGPHPVPSSFPIRAPGPAPALNASRPENPRRFVLRILQKQRQEPQNPDELRKVCPCNFRIAGGTRRLGRVDNVCSSVFADL